MTTYPFELFDTLKSQITIKAVLRAQVPMRVGRGRSMDHLSTDLPVLRDSSGSPFLPGSSLKGVMRSGVEAMLRAIAPPDQEIRWACDPLRQKGSCIYLTLPEEDSEENDDEGGSPIDRALRLQDGGAKLHQVLRRICLACATFGVPGLSSHVYFHDAPLVQSRENPAHIEVRDGVAIDRDLGRVSGSSKYDFEVVSAGSTFQFTLTLLNAQPWQTWLTFVALRLLDDGVLRIGGASSRGFGAFRVEQCSFFEQTAKQIWLGEPGTNFQLGTLSDALSNQTVQSYRDAWKELCKDRGAEL